MAPEFSITTQVKKCNLWKIDSTLATRVAGEVAVMVKMLKKEKHSELNSYFSKIHLNC